MQWTCREITARNQLYGFMKYQVKCDLPGYFSAREWCWNRFGPGIEFAHWKNYFSLVGVAMPWAWESDKFQGASINSGKLYFPDDATLAAFEYEWKT